MDGYRIETNEDGELSYRGWRILVVPCNISLPNDVPKHYCNCGAPMYLAAPPYEGEYEDWGQVWERTGAISSPDFSIDPYKEYFLAKHVSQETGQSTIQRAIDRFEESLTQLRAEAWAEYKEKEGVQ